MTNTDELKPCPFCGSENSQMVFGPSCTRSSPYDPGDRAFPIVRCSCGVDVGGLDWDETKQSAIKAWNTRAPASLEAIDQAGLVIMPRRLSDEIDEALSATSGLSNDAVWQAVLAALNSDAAESSRS